MSFRKIIFWLHLIAGVVAGIVIAIMSFTGAVLAFEKEIIAWAERDSRTVPLPHSTDAVPLDDIVAKIREEKPEARPSTITVQRNPESAVMLGFGRTNSVYVNPYTAEIQPPSGTGMRSFMQTMISWHRYLGRANDQRATGKAITGACNAAFLVLAVTGIYLWWPRKWNRGAFRAVAVFSLKLRGKARDWNWHNAVGFWTAPILIVLTATALPISYRWAGDLIYKMTGTTSPQNAGPGGITAPAVEIPTPPEGAKPLKLQELLGNVQREFPNWKEITFRMGGPGGRGGTGERRSGSREGATEASRSEISATNAVASAASPGSRERGEGGSREAGGRSNRAPQPVSITLKEKNAWPLFSAVQLTLDPFTGAVLRKETYSDQNLGRQVRSWTRYLHTGEALGVVGQLVAGVASLVSLLLVWTGFALTWRRFFKRKETTATTS